MVPSPQLNGKIRCFAPVIDHRVRVLILGSLPSAKSIVVQEYYGNRQNLFWNFMEDVLGRDLIRLPYAERLLVLLECGVGLWDVIAEANRNGSLDANIRDHCANDLLALLARFPSVRAIAFNGETAARLGLRQLGAHAERYWIVRLPSSSRAHTLAPLEKLGRWRELRSALP